MSAVPPLPRKQSGDHDEWVQVWQSIVAEPDVARAQRLVEQAAERVRRRVASLDRVAYGWSGGKDSLGLQVVMDAAGVRDAVLVISALEYPAFLSYVEEHAPAGLTVVVREHIDHAWLRERPGMLFPRDSSTAARWYSTVQHAGQRAYVRDRRLDALILGRRRADGNFVGKDLGHGPEYVDRDGFVRLSPIADWSHEDLLHVIAWAGLTLPPIYDWPRGFIVGTGPWAARTGTLSIDHGWSEVMRIDRTVVETAAAEGIPGAERALRGDYGTES